jgi:diacylglycerol kinase family enzyme
MTGTWCLVVNPAAGHGRGTRVLPAVLGALARGPGGPAGIRVSQATGLAGAARTAASAAGRGETVVAVGGDGLVGTLAAALAGTGAPLGIIPAGSGNDFARMLGIPARPRLAAQALLDRARRPVDLVGVRAGDAPEQVVAGSVYLGVPADGGELAGRSRLPGTARYKVAGVRALARWRPTTFTVHAGPGPGGSPLVAGFAVVVANAAYFGAGLKAAPAADLSDGLLDVVTVAHGGKLSFLRVMLSATRGAHTRLPQVGTTRAASVTVTADRPVTAGADGEPLPGACPLPPGSPLHIRVIPGALEVLAPAAAAGVAQPGPAAGARPPRKDSTKSGLADSSDGVPAIRTSPPPST